MDPPIVAEATSFLQLNDMDKMRKLVKIRELLTERFGVTFKAYFFCLAVDKYVEHEADKFASENEILLIKQMKKDRFE